MSKCVAVIDIPDNCFNCPFIVNECHKTNLYCLLAPNNRMCLSLTRKQLWCPLKPLPEKKPELVMDIIHSESIECGYYDGWNACLEQIRGNK